VPLVVVCAWAEALDAAPRPVARGRRPVVTEGLVGMVASVVACEEANADVGDILEAARRNSDITYSSNARNLKRMQAGDYSMGSQQTSTTERALKRRAVMACKSPKVLKATTYAGEADCTKSVLGGDADPVLAALDRLGDDCKVDATHVCM